MATVTIWMDEELKDEVFLLARVLGISASEVCRRGLGAFIEQQKASPAIFAQMSALSIGRVRTDVFEERT